MSDRDDFTNDPTVPVSPYFICPACRGYVMHFNTYNGDVDDGCDYCDDTGSVRARDSKGRFIGNPTEHRNDA